MLNNATVLTLPAPVAISPTRPESAKTTGSSPWDAPCPKEGRSERRGEEGQTVLRVCRSPLQLILANEKTPPALPNSENLIPPLSAANTSHGPQRVSTRWGWAGQKSDFFSILLGLFFIVSTLIVMSGATSAVAAAEASPDKAVAESPSEPAQGNRRLLPSLMGATPEERARLTEERKSLSATAAANGTDPTAIVGYNQLTYGHGVFTNGLNLESATAVVQLPFTPNLAVRATLPYVWADLDQPRGFTTNGTSDLFVRVGGRVYSSPNLALLVGFDTSFPTGSNDRLSTGKYGLGPGAAVRVPLARLRSLFVTLVQDFNSVGGDPSRRDIHFMQVQPSITTIWSERWWTTVGGVWAIDWNNDNKTVVNLQGEIGHRLDDRWRLFVQPSAGVAGKDTPLGLDWGVQAGVRWMFSGSLFPERLFESLPVEGPSKY